MCPHGLICSEWKMEPWLQFSQPGPLGITSLIALKRSLYYKISLLPEQKCFHHRSDSSLWLQELRGQGVTPSNVSWCIHINITPSHPLDWRLVGNLWSWGLRCVALKRRQVVMRDKKLSFKGWHPVVGGEFSANQAAWGLGGEETVTWQVGKTIHLHKNIMRTKP